MTQNPELMALLEAAQRANSIDLALLDRILAVEGSLDVHLETILNHFGPRPIDDDVGPLGAGAGAASASGPVPAAAPDVRFLTAAEELRLSKRIEFTKKRLAWTVALAGVAPEVQQRYRALTEVELGFVPAPVRIPPDEADIRERWQEYLVQRNWLIEVNLPLVERISMRYRTYGIPGGDLIQHGSLGLIRAADKFDWRKNVRFRTYAEWWIRQAIERATDTDREVIHVPRPMRQKLSKANHLHRASGSTQPLDPSRFAEMMQLDRAAAARVFSIKSGIVSLERSGQDDGHSLKNDLIGTDLGHRDEVEEEEHVKRRLDGLISELPSRERRVLYLRYGLAGESEHTLEEVGDILGISRERVRQLQLRALDQLRERSPDARCPLGE